MASTRLTKEMRAAIVRRIVDKTKPAQEAKLRGWEHALAVRLIRHRYGDDVFERCRALPEGWLEVHKTVSFDYKLRQVLPQRRRVEWMGRFRSEVVYPSGHVDLSEYAPLPNSIGKDWTRECIGEALFEEVVSLFDAKIDLQKDIELLRQQVAAVLASFATVERLAADWPEGYAELPAEMLVPKTEGLPAPRIADLNERISKLREAA